MLLVWSNNWSNRINAGKLEFAQKPHGTMEKCVLRSYSTTENANISQQACDMWLHLGTCFFHVTTCHNHVAVVIRRVRKSWLATLKNSSACRIGNQGNACPGCQIFQLWANRNNVLFFVLYIVRHLLNMIRHTAFCTCITQSTLENALRAGLMPCLETRLPADGNV